MCLIRPAISMVNSHIGYLQHIRWYAAELNQAPQRWLEREHLSWIGNEREHVEAVAVITDGALNASKTGVCLIE